MPRNAGGVGRSPPPPGAARSLAARQEEPSPLGASRACGTTPRRRFRAPGRSSNLRVSRIIGAPASRASPAEPQRARTFALGASARCTSHFGHSARLPPRPRDVYRHGLPCARHQRRGVGELRGTTSVPGKTGGRREVATAPVAAPRAATVGDGLAARAGWRVGTGVAWPALGCATTGGSKLWPVAAGGVTGGAEGSASTTGVGVACGGPGVAVTTAGAAGGGLVWPNKRSRTMAGPAARRKMTMKKPAMKASP